MTFYKEVFDKEKYRLVFINDENNTFIIQYGGCDLYWIMLDYKDDNEFIININDEIFEQLEQIFNQIEIYDNNYDRTLNDNIFEWISEARIPELSSKLIIEKGDNFYKIKFIQNENDIYAKMHNICPVCFCMSGSRNQNIAYAFSTMYVSYNEKVKKLN